MAESTEMIIHGVMTPVLKLNVTAEEFEEQLRSEVAADEAEKHAQAAKKAEEEAKKAAAQAGGPEVSFVVAALSASGWSDNTYSFEATYPKESYDLSIEVAPTATAEQFEAFGGAMICGSADSNIATALGDVPTVDIPIIIKVVAK